MEEISSETDHIKNADRKKIFVRSWIPIRDDPVLGNPEAAAHVAVRPSVLDTVKLEHKAVVFIAHGVGEHSGRYEQLGSFLKDHKIAVHSHDHIGHGKSSGERVLIDDFQIYVRDVIQHIELLKAKYTKIPLFLWGHSMGGTVTALLVIQRPELVDGVVFSAPAIVPGAGVVLRGLVRVAAFFAPRLQVVHIDPNTISREPDEVRAYVEDPLVWHEGLKAGWVKEMLKAQSEICDRIADIKIPFITVHGTGDTLVDISSSQFLFDNASSEDRMFEKFQDGRHELVNDVDRDRFKQVTLDWLTKHIPTSSE